MRDIKLPPAITQPNDCGGKHGKGRERPASRVAKEFTDESKTEKASGDESQERILDKHLKRQIKDVHTLMPNK